MKKFIVVATLFASSFAHAGLAKVTAKHVVKPGAKVSWSVTRTLGKGLKKGALAVGHAVGYVAFQVARASY